MKKWRKWDIDCIQSSIWILAAISVCIYGGLEVIVWVLMEDNLVAPDNLWPVARYIFNFLWYEETFWNLFAGWKKTGQGAKQILHAAVLLPLSDIQLPAIMRSREISTSSAISAAKTTSTSTRTTSPSSIKITVFEKMRPSLQEAIIIHHRHQNWTIKYWHNVIKNLDSRKLLIHGKWIFSSNCL